MADYSNGKIYKIFNTIDDDIYVGSTVETLQKRFTRHKSTSTKKETQHFLIYQKMNDIGFSNFRIELIEEYPCNNKTELNAREGYWIRQIGTLNKTIQGRTRQEYKHAIKDITKEKAHEYYEKNKEKIKETHRTYYEQNKERFKEHYKQYREENKDKKRELDKSYREKHQDKIKEYRRTRIICECGCEILKIDKARHCRSNKHLELLESKTITTTKSQ